MSGDAFPAPDRMWFDGDRSEIVLSIERQAQPFSNLSAGQRMMLALVADIAIKAVTQNNHLVPEDMSQPLRTELCLTCWLRLLASC